MYNKKDLEFLHYAESQDIKVLSNIIKNKHGEALTWENCADELLLMGGNTLVNLVRGHGVPYKTLLIDLCKKMKVKVNNKNDSIINLEEILLKNILVMSLENLHQKLLEQILNELKIPHPNFTKQDMVEVLKISIQRGGLAPYRIAEIVDNAVFEKLVGRGLAFAAYAVIDHFMFIFAGPVGWAWALIDLFGPAYRVTLPSAIKIACIRAKLNYSG